MWAIGLALGLTACASATAPPRAAAAADGDQPPWPTAAEIDARWDQAASQRSLPVGVYSSSFEGQAEGTFTTYWHEAIEYQGRYALDIGAERVRLLLDYRHDTTLTAQGQVPATTDGHEVYLWTGRVEDRDGDRVTFWLEPARYTDCRGLLPDDAVLMVSTGEAHCSSAVAPIELDCGWRDATLTDVVTGRDESLDLLWCDLSGGRVGSWLAIEGQVPLSRRPGVHAVGAVGEPTRLQLDLDAVADRLPSH